MRWVCTDWEKKRTVYIDFGQGRFVFCSNGWHFGKYERSRFRVFAPWLISLLFNGILLWIFFKHLRSWSLTRFLGIESRPRVYLRIFFRNFFGYHFLEGFARVQKNSDSSEIGLFQDYFNVEPQVLSSKQTEARGLPNWAHLISAHQWKFFNMFLSTSYLL